jgi:hypothetical protein
MPYAPGTKLSHSDSTERATVLTDGKVMVTRGFAVTQIMKLADWFILADGATIYEDYIPLESDKIDFSPPVIRIHPSAA